MGAAAATIADAREILLVCHINPDGDTLGSMIALALGLEQQGKACTLLSADGVPPLYDFLPTASELSARPSGATSILPSSGRGRSVAHRCIPGRGAQRAAPDGH
jgi:hypothetical protein